MNAIRGLSISLSAQGVRFLRIVIKSVQILIACLRCSSHVRSFRAFEFAKVAVKSLVKSAKSYAANFSKCVSPF